MKEISISKITIKIGQKEVELTPEEAKQLKKSLSDLLDVPSQTIIVKPYIQNVPYYPYTYPWHYQTWCGSSTSQGHISNQIINAT